MLDVFGEELGTLPSGDGMTTGENPAHQRAVRDLQHALEAHFRDRDDVFVGGQLPMFFEKGNRNRHCSPDVMVALETSNQLRENYKIWEEGKAPDLVLEVTTAATRFEDFGEKRGLYAFLGIPEYLIFDPQGDYLVPPLRLYRLDGEDYRRVLGERLLLETVNLEVSLLEGELRLKTPETGELLPTIEETRAQVFPDEAHEDPDPPGLSQEELENSTVIQSDEADRLATELEEMRRL